MANAEHKKLIQELKRCYNSLKDGSQGFMYPMYPMGEYAKRRQIWGKRALKKGYLEIVETFGNYLVYKITKKGIDKLYEIDPLYIESRESRHLQPVQSYDKVTDNKLSAKERRKLRRLKRQGRI